MGAVKMGLIAILVLNWLAWIVLLAGAGSLQSFCGDNFVNVDCSAWVSFEWWIVWFQLFVLVGATIVTVMTSLAASRFSWFFMVAIVTAIMMVSANNIYHQKQSIGRPLGARGDFDNRLSAMLAGLIMCIILNMLWILLAPFMDDSFTSGGRDNTPPTQGAPKGDIENPRPRTTGTVPPHQYTTPQHTTSQQYTTAVPTATTSSTYAGPPSSFSKPPPAAQR